MPALSRYLAVAVVLGLAACASHDRAGELSPAARRSLTEAMQSGDSDADSNADTGTDALDALREAARRAPDDALAQQRYGLAAERAGQYGEALAALDRAVQGGAVQGGAGPEAVLAQRLLALGRVAIEAGDVPAATRAYARVLEREGGNLDALNGLGVAEDLEHHHAQARERYEAALRLAPGDWRTRSNLAMSLLMSGRAAEAAAALAGADQDPAAPRRARHDLALALVAAGRRGQAIAVLQADMPAPQAAALADAFAGFARWLASPQGRLPAPR